MRLKITASGISESVFKRFLDFIKPKQKVFMKQPSDPRMKPQHAIDVGDGQIVTFYGEKDFVCFRNLYPDTDGDLELFKLIDEFAKKENLNESGSPSSVTLSRKPR